MAGTVGLEPTTFNESWMKMTLQSGEDFLLKDCRAGIARIRRIKTRPLVALDCAVEPLDQGKSGMWRADLHPLGGCDIEASRGSHRHRAFVGSLVFSHVLDQLYPIPSLEAVNPLDRLCTRPWKAKPVRAAHLPAAPALCLNGGDVGNLAQADRFASLPHAGRINPMRLGIALLGAVELGSAARSRGHGNAQGLQGGDDGIPCAVDRGRVFERGFPLRNSSSGRLAFF